MKSNRVLTWVLSIVCGLILTSVCSSSAHAQLQFVSPDMPTTKVSGTFSDQGDGILITFPDGWSGNAIHSDNDTVVILTKNATEPFETINLSIVDKATVEKIVGHVPELTLDNSAFRDAMNISSEGCDITNPTTITLNGMSGTQMTSQCSVFGTTLKYEMTLFDSDKNFVLLNFIAPTEEFEKLGTDFNETLNTLRISNPATPPTDLRPITSSDTIPSQTKETTPQTKPHQTIPQTTTQSTPPQSAPQPLQPRSIPQPNIPVHFQPTSAIGIRVATDKPSYSSGDILIAKVDFTGSNTAQNIAVEIKDPTGNTILLRTVTTDRNGAASLQFNLPSNAHSGSYHIVASSSFNDNVFGDSVGFNVQSASLPTGSVQETTQQGNPPSSHGFIDDITKFFRDLFHF